MDEFKARHVHSLRKLPGMTAELAQALYDAGYRNKGQLFLASENDLKKVPGMTTAKVNALKAYKDQVKAKSKAEKWDKQK
jgi:DNA uptake protein ComE-like DNA-binding protein